MLRISCINQSTLLSDADAAPMVDAVQEQNVRDVAPAWPGTEARFTFVPKGEVPAPGEWWILFVDTPADPGTLGQHQLTDAGQPLGYVFVKADLDSGSKVATTFSHEAIEMPVDPWLNKTYTIRGSKKTLTFSAEPGDPTEDDRYCYYVGNVPVSNFVTPNWFNYRYHDLSVAGEKLDHLGLCKAPLEILPGGYMAYQDSTRGDAWLQVEKETAGKQTAPIQGYSRRSRRAMPIDQWRLSAPIQKGK